MSKTGIESCSPEVQKQLAIICGAVCVCENHGKQKCVDSMLLFHNKMEEKSQILVEHPYYLPKDLGDPVPMMSSGGWGDFIPSLGRLIGSARLAKTEGVPQSVIDGYLKKETNMRDIRTAGDIESIESYSKGELSIPDTVIVKERNKPAIGDNMLGVAEVKFPPDKWRDEQYEAAKRIAGGKEKVHTLTPDNCFCREKEQRMKDQLSAAALTVSAAATAFGLSRMPGLRVLGEAQTSRVIFGGDTRWGGKNGPT